MLLSSILIGADRWGVSLLGVQFKVAEIFLVIATFLMIISKRFYSANNKWVYFFVITSFISFLFGYSIQRGILFYFYIIFNVIFIYFLYFNYAKYYGADKLIKVFRTSFYVNFGVLLFQYLVNTIFRYNIPFLSNYGTYAGVHRYQSFFYEPSYLATYVVFWLACSLFQLFIGKDKGYLIDVALALIMLLISTSSTGFVGFDDSPRRGNKARVIKGQSVEKFEKYLDELLKLSIKHNKEFLFLTAWNEWGEGAYLEPDSVDEYKYLEAVKRVVDRNKK